MLFWLSIASDVCGAEEEGSPEVDTLGAGSFAETGSPGGNVPVEIDASQGDVPVEEGSPEWNVPVEVRSSWLNVPVEGGS